MTKKRAMALGDAQNLRSGSRNDKGGIRNDPVKPVDALGEDYDLLRSYWFDAYPPGEADAKEGLFHVPETNRFRVDATSLRQREGECGRKGHRIDRPLVERVSSDRHQ
ncbi:hypothetical protein BRC90_08285 [Halobacteriales archaeon QS_4_69_34]|nr:MAG: hypothetical protein BRC90_08285 [Halobacteriales archaeon QS_4_69_34]